MTKGEPKTKHLKNIADRVDNFSMDHYRNIQLIVEYAGEHLNADAVFYNKFVDGELETHAAWYGDPGFNEVNNAYKHLCSDVMINGISKCLIISDLKKSSYFVSDPNITKYDPHTYVGYGVECKDKPVGSLCVFFSVEKEITEFEEDLLRILGTFVGIEESRMESEEEALKSTEFLRSLIEDSIDMIIGVDKDQNIVIFNKAAQTRFGYCINDIIGKHISTVYANKNEGLRVFKLLSERGEFKGEVINIDKHGNEFTSYLSSAMLYSKYGNYLGTVGISRDITEQKKAAEALRLSEEKFRFLVENSAELVWAVDLDMKYTYVSPSFERLTGYKQDELMHSNLCDYLIPEEVARFKDFISNKLELKDYLPDIIQVRVIYKNGESAWNEMSISFILDDTGNPLGIQGISRDITDKKELEISLFKRDEILQVVSTTADKLLNNNDWEEDIDSILGEIGRVTGVSRVYIFENGQNKDGYLITSRVFEWCNEDIDSEFDENLVGLAMNTDAFERWVDVLSSGKPLFGSVDELPEKEKNLANLSKTQSFLIIPIFTDEEWWGFIGFDECCYKRVWLEAEIDALKIVAKTISTGIQRDIRIEMEEILQRERWEQAEKEVRVQLENTVFNPTRESKQNLFKALTLMHETTATHEG